MYFNPQQISVVNRSFLEAELLIQSHFSLSPREFASTPYDVRTLAFLEGPEIKDRAFAHLCRYYYEKDRKGESKGLHFYRVCLQDNRILEAVQRANPFIRLFPLMLYIATHELIHVIRFDRGESDFDLSSQERAKEEEKVHRITRTVLKGKKKLELDLVLDCFSNKYELRDLN